MTERAKASKLIYLPVTSFVQNVASRAPVPGGGSVAALSASLGAALEAMVCRISSTRMGEDARPYFEEVEQEAMGLRDDLRDLVDADSDAYEAVIAAAKSGDAGASSDAARKAAEVPLRTAELARRAMDLLENLAKKAYPGAVTDVGVAALMLQGAVKGAGYNVLVNLPSVGDGAFGAEAREKLEQWNQEAAAIAAAVAEIVTSRMES